MVKFDLTTEKRKELLDVVTQKLEDYYANTKDLKVSADWGVSEVRAYAQHFELDQHQSPQSVLEHLIEGLSKYAVHTPHPNYYGLFNPRPSFVSILGDLIAAAFNPQLAAWSHSPLANEIENYIIQEFGEKFGYKKGSIDGTFCSGGAESNLTAVISALNFHFPKFNETGVLGIGKIPMIYCSSESHHSIVKAAKVTGLSVQAVRSIPVNGQLQMDIDLLNKQIELDRQAGYLPFMIVGTAGTTGAGAIDDLDALHKVATKEHLWLHIDAAYGGAITISHLYQKHLKGIHLADSITLDLHKWFSVPMGASLFLTQNTHILHQSFGVKTNYMPADGDATKIVDPYIHSMQWSRRFIGLKVYLPLVIHGWEGYQETINHQVKMGDLFRDLLIKKGWHIKNDSVLPIICFTHEDFNSNDELITAFANEVMATGKAWFSLYPIDGKMTLRVCMTNYATTTVEVNELMDLLEKMRVKSGFYELI